MSNVSFSYDQEAISEAEKLYSRVKYEGAQRKLVEEASEIISEHIGINTLALRGFMLRAVKQWQEESKTEIHTLAQKSPSERIKAVREIIGYLKQLLRKVLKDPTMQEKLDESIKAGFTTYLRKYAGRDLEN